MRVHELFIYICVKDAAQAIAFYTEAFGAREKYRLVEPSGRLGHAEIDLGGTVLMLADEFPEYGFAAPPQSGGTKSVVLHLHVDDADEVIRRAIAAGARLEREPKDEFYGERSGSVIDPFGYHWMIGHKIEDVTPAEMQRRYDAAAKTC